MSEHFEHLLTLHRPKCDVEFPQWTPGEFKKSLHNKVLTHEDFLLHRATLTVVREVRCSRTRCDHDTDMNSILNCECILHVCVSVSTVRRGLSHEITAV